MADKWIEIKTVAVHSSLISEYKDIQICCGLQHLCVVGPDRKVIAVYSHISSLCAHLHSIRMRSPCSIDHVLQQSI